MGWNALHRAVLCTEHCPIGSPSTKWGPGHSCVLESCHQALLNTPSLLGRKGRRHPASPFKAHIEN